jgi:hypothetical protein
MRTVLGSILTAVSLLACGAEQTRECTLAQVREVVLAQQRAGPTSATQDDIAPATESGTRYNVTLDCGKERLYAVFTSASGFDASAYTRGLEVAVTVDGQEVRLKRGNKLEAVGHVSAQKPGAK